MQLHGGWMENRYAAVDRAFRAANFNRWQSIRKSNLFLLV
jgi:hypothetical protein